MSPGRMWRWASAAAVGMLLAAPAIASAADFDPSVEFATDPYVKIELGPLDLSINKAVFYLFLASVICIAMGLVIRGGLKMKPMKFTVQMKSRSAAQYGNHRAMARVGSPCSATWTCATS